VWVSTPPLGSKREFAIWHQSAWAESVPGSGRKATEGEYGDVVRWGVGSPKAVAAAAMSWADWWLMDWVRSKPKSSLVGEVASTTPSVTSVRV
jgi:hypothetical protein